MNTYLSSKMISCSRLFGTEGLVFVLFDMRHAQTNEQKLFREREKRSLHASGDELEQNDSSSRMQKLVVPLPPVQVRFSRLGLLED